MLRRTSDSEPEWPSTMALVLSHTMASTPSSPSARKLSSSVGGPTIGAGSSLKSPVWRMIPYGVRIASACDSGTEWVTGMKRRLYGGSSKDAPGLMTVTLASPCSCASPSFRRSTAAANGGGEDRAAQLPPQMGHRAEMVLVGVGDHEADEVLPALGDERRVGHHDLDFGVLGAPKADAAIDGQPFTVAAV